MCECKCVTVQKEQPKTQTEPNETKDRLQLHAILRLPYSTCSAEREIE